MIEKDPPFFWDVSCDQCSAGEERISTDEAETFIEVVRVIKERGWRVFRDRLEPDEWVHQCPDCAEA